MDIKYEFGFWLNVAEIEAFSRAAQGALYIKWCDKNESLNQHKANVVDNPLMEHRVLNYTGRKYKFMISASLLQHRTTIVRTRNKGSIYIIIFMEIVAIQSWYESKERIWMNKNMISVSVVSALGFFVSCHPTKQNQTKLMPKRYFFSRQTKTFTAIFLPFLVYTIWMLKLHQREYKRWYVYVDLLFFFLALVHNLYCTKIRYAWLYATYDINRHPFQCKHFSFIFVIATDFVRSSKDDDGDNNKIIRLCKITHIIFCYIHMLYTWHMYLWLYHPQSVNISHRISHDRRKSDFDVRILFCLFLAEFEFVGR